MLRDEESRWRRELAQASAAVAEATQELQEIRAGRRLYRFIEERATGEQYARYLGVIALIRKDFRALARLLNDARKAREQELELADSNIPPIDRIVLYIDDLDRCPAHRVVEVLEAVHLLLAFPLFVVVVGVDSRWLLQSLERHYAIQLAGSLSRQVLEGDGELPRPSAEELKRWVATPQSYLEKIFQIPFTIPAMGPDGFGRLISDLLVVEPGGGDHSEVPADGRDQDLPSPDQHPEVGGEAAGSGASLGAPAPPPPPRVAATQTPRPLARPEPQRSTLPSICTLKASR